MLKRKPSCLGISCVFYSTDPCCLGCMIGEEDRESLNILCPCENGEYEAMFGENGELYDG